MPTEPAYVAIAGEIARSIRSGQLEPGTQLPAQPELADQHGVSGIVIRKAVDLLRRQGLVRTVRRRGTFVSEGALLVRVSPERQVETAETSFANEAVDVQVDRDKSQVPATDDLAEAFGLPAGSDVTRIVTRISANGSPAAISDSYESAQDDVGKADFLEETLAVRPPGEEHASYLGVPPGEMVVTIHQRFLTGDDRTMMVSDITYPLAHYAAYVFRMQLPPREETGR